MNYPIPTRDGQVVEYSGEGAQKVVPRIYYVNGIQTTGAGHAKTAHTLSVLTEHAVFGVFNATAGIGHHHAGMARDLLQCVEDWGDIVGSKLLEIGVARVNAEVNAVVHLFRKKSTRSQGNPIAIANTVRKAIPSRLLVSFLKYRLETYNPATASLFDQLNKSLGRQQYILAHSQGNLITSDALWSMVIARGESSLANMRVYSLASPTPAWPMGIRYRRKVYGFTNDLVTLADPHNWTGITKHVFNGIFGPNAGDWRQYGSSSKPGIAAHDVYLNIALNFSRTIRADLGLPPLTAAAPGKP